VEAEEVVERFGKRDVVVAVVARYCEKVVVWE